MTIVSDTGPLIALAKIDHLWLLENLFSELYIPPMVHRELLAKNSPEAVILDQALSGFIHVAAPPTLPAEVETATHRLDPSEQQAVALAYHRQEPIMLDDRLGRAAAKKLGLRVTGTAAVLLQAKKSLHIPAVRPLLIEIRQNGYWLSDEFLNAVTKLAGEL
ncbi:MAG: DUF3368 domain-containing protein [Anaerolineae bacterium]|nr:DUF3368 domain-containing protein [Anaerolineae bacterium]